MQKKIYLSALIGVLISLPSAAANTPVGKWITLDHATNKPTGIVEITEHAGRLQGKIIAGFGVDRIILCTKCTGSLKNKPVIGLTFLDGFVPSDSHTWTQGHILNPHDGKIYPATLTLADDGKKLQLRGYWGIFYRTENWIRSDNQTE